MDRKQPVAYIRRSSAGTDNDGEVSEGMQRDAILAKAHAEGHNGDVVWYSAGARCMAMRP